MVTRTRRVRLPLQRNMVDPTTGSVCRPIPALTGRSGRVRSGPVCGKRTGSSVDGEEGDDGDDGDDGDGNVGISISQTILQDATNEGHG